MSLQTLIVAAVVITAFAYAGWALTPAALRRRITSGLIPMLGGREATGLRGRVVAKLERIAARSGGGCNDCAANVLTPAERNSRRTPR